MGLLKDFKFEWDIAAKGLRPGGLCDEGRMSVYGGARKLSSVFCACDCFLQLFRCVFLVFDTLILLIALFHIIVIYFYYRSYSCSYGENDSVDERALESQVNMESQNVTFGMQEEDKC